MMFGFIASETYSEDIVKAIEQQPIFHRTGNFNSEEFGSIINAAIRVTLNTLVVDITCVSEDALYKGLKLYKVQRSETRIILFAPGKKPGDKLISNLVSLGVWDIVAPDLPELDEENDDEEIDFEVWPEIKNRLNNTYAYGNAVRWHVVSDDFQTEREEVVHHVKGQTKVITKKVKKVETKVVVEHKYVTVPNNTVAVVSLSLKAGSSFIAANLAKAFVENEISAALLESPVHRLGRTYLFDYLGIEMLERNDLGFYSLPHVIKSGQKIESDHFIEVHGVECLAVDPREEKITNWNYENVLHYFHASKSTVKIIDLGYIRPNKELDKVFKQIIKSVDCTFVVVDPIPHEITANNDIYSELQLMKNEGYNIEFVLNKWNEGIEQTALKEIGLNTKELLKMPYINAGLLYKTIYKCEIPYQNEEIALLMQENIYSLMKHIIPNMKVKQMEQKKTNSLLKIFTKK